jgi:methylmalonyl-CoA mutase
MTFPKPHGSLFADFKPTSKSEWEEKIKKDLKGRDPAILHTPTPENITINPFYTREDIDQLPHLQALPGRYPFIRGHKTTTNQWQNLVEVAVAGNSQAAVDQARRALAGGADGLHFRLAAPEKLDLDYLAGALNLGQVPLAFTIPNQPRLFLDKLFQALRSHHHSPRDLQGFLLVHPPRATEISYATGGQLVELLEQTREAAGFYGLTVHGAQFGSRGATAVQEIAFTLSLAVHYLDQLSARGFAQEEICRNLQLTVSSGTHYFMEIAKLRALRWLWAGIVKACGEAPATAASLRIHAHTSSWTHTTLDPHSNILRATTEAMSAIIGGCDSLSVAPFDSMAMAQNPFSERIARNIPLLLKHEAYLDQVLDPAAGSYYLESLTQQLAEKAWALFQEVQGQGGFAGALQGGFIRAQLSSSAQASFQAITSGQQVLVGTNKFANPREQVDYDAEALLQSRHFDTSRASYPFEVMRLAAILHYQKKKARPKAIIAIVGHDIQEHIHAAFAQEFFACGDFDTQILSFDTVEAALEKLLFTDCRIIVFSSIESDYARFSRHFREALKNHKNRPDLILAAAPAEMKQELAEHGFDGYIFQNCDVAQIISRIQEKLVTQGNEL